MKLKCNFFLKIKPVIKRILSSLKYYYFIEPFSNSVMNAIYIAKINRWISEHPLNDTDIFDHRFELFNYLQKTFHLEDDIYYLEFGVSSGDSLRWWVENNKNQSSRFIGFDTFSGLPENWGKVEIGTFSTQGKTPEINDERVSYRIGMFQDTLSDFIESVSITKRKVIHLDADLYSSTLYVLTTLAGQLKKGDILIFDDFAKWRTTDHVFRAFCDFYLVFDFKYKLLGASDYFEQIVIELL